MKSISPIILVLLIAISCKKHPTTIQNKAASKAFKIDSNTVKKHLYILASDDMEGRGTGTPGIEKAAVYIENEFKRIGLTTFQDLETYRQTFTFENRRTQEKITASNIIGVLEGKSRKDEFVVVSAHFDHLGIRKTTGQLDSIYNGANDDASGVTGVLTLAEYFKNKGTNERTIVFVAFTGEEMGLKGSTHFGKEIDGQQVCSRNQFRNDWKNAEFWTQYRLVNRF